MKEWTRELASKEGKYGGGSAASAVGAIAVSLAQFVFELQEGKKRYRDQEDEIQQAIKTASHLNEELLELVEKDAKAFEPVLSLFGLPQGTKAEKRYRREKIDIGLVNAALPPFETMMEMAKVVELFQTIIELEVKGTIVDDIAVGLHISIAAIESAKISSMVNIKQIKNQKIKKEMTIRVENQYQKTMERIRELLSSV